MLGELTVTGDDLVAHEAQISKQLMVMGLAVSQTTLLVVAMSEERLLALGADKMLQSRNTMLQNLTASNHLTTHLNMPVLSQRRNDALLDRTPTRATNRNSHPIVAPQAIQLVHIVGRVPGTVLHLPGRRVQLDPARGTVKVVPVVDLTPEPQRRIVNHSVALVAHVLAQPNLLLLSVAVVAQRPVLVPDEARIGQRDAAPLARKAIRMPVGGHRLDDAPNHKVVALVAARRKQDVEVLLAVLATLELVENPILELPEALGTTATDPINKDTFFTKKKTTILHKALSVPQLSVGVDDPLMRFEALVATGTHHRAERHVGGNSEMKHLF